jgi:hypothetical protein
VSATDSAGASLPATCSPASGSTFPLGTTTVICAATDAHQQSATGSFTVRVRDTTPPTITDTPASQIREATSAAGAAVTYASPTAQDLVSGSIVVACSPASGGTFPLGTTTVTCTATDGANNTASASFTVQVRDTTAPAFSGVPGNQTREATSAAGAVVSYTAPTASDLVDGAVPVTCSPASGSTFPLGTTTVTCTATDHAGNGASASFTVSVGYSWSGILQPINADGSSVFRRGSTVPVKFRLTGASGAITDAVARLSYQFVNGNAGAVNEAASTSQATTGNLFRYDPSSGLYIFNWSTTGLAVGTYDLLIDLGDGVQHTVRLQLR